MSNDAGKHTYGEEWDIINLAAPGADGVVAIPADFLVGTAIQYIMRSTTAFTIRRDGRTTTMTIPADTEFVLATRAVLVDQNGNLLTNLPDLEVTSCTNLEILVQGTASKKPDGAGF